MRDADGKMKSREYWPATWCDVQVGDWVARCGGLLGAATDFYVWEITDFRCGYRDAQGRPNVYVSAKSIPIYEDDPSTVLEDLYYVGDSVYIAGDIVDYAQISENPLRYAESYVKRLVDWQSKRNSNSERMSRN